MMKRGFLDVDGHKEWTEVNTRRSEPARRARLVESATCVIPFVNCPTRLRILEA